MSYFGEPIYPGPKRRAAAAACVLPNLHRRFVGAHRRERATLPIALPVPSTGMTRRGEHQPPGALSERR